MPFVKIRIAALVNEQSAAGLLLLWRDIFALANRLLEADRYAVEFVSAIGASQVELRDVVITTKRASGRYDFAIVAPLDRAGSEPVPLASDVEFIRKQHGRGTIIASACLGALTLASAGILEGREATTHWNWASFARARYPDVRWATSQMVSDHGDVITAGGYLAIIDLALYIVAKTASKELSHRLGQRLLADSVRQRQSVYAQTLIEPQVEHPALSALPQWIERHLGEPLLAPDLAKQCRMSLRTFHRQFESEFKTTPRKYIQLKRIEKAQELLRTSRKSLAQILETIGVSDVASFRRIFQREIGYSPAAFRRQLRRG
jgi:transcriptional regulator GlxA family with amidase domain